MIRPMLLRDKRDWMPFLFKLYCAFNFPPVGGMNPIRATNRPDD